MTTCELPLAMQGKFSGSTISCISPLKEGISVPINLEALMDYTMSGAQFMGPTAQFGIIRVKLGTEDTSLFRQQNAEGVQKFAEEWKALLLDRDAPVTAKALMATVKPLFQALSVYGAGAVDLSGLSPDSVNGMHLAVILRATFSRKNQTVGWETALSVAREALNRDCINPDRALAGLS